jgi:hypothetical protein
MFVERCSLEPRWIVAIKKRRAICPPLLMVELTGVEPVTP